MGTNYRRLGSSLVTARHWWRQHAGELARFGTVGVAGIVVDAGVFNLLRLGPLSPDAVVAGGVDRVVTAKIIATLVAILFAWVSHRVWTFKDRKTGRPARELLVFVVVNAVALGIQAGVLAITHHGLGLTSALADNISAYAIGLPLGTVARYFGYKAFVFTGDDSRDAA